MGEEFTRRFQRILRRSTAYQDRAEIIARLWLKEPLDERATDALRRADAGHKVLMRMQRRSEEEWYCALGD